MISFFILSFSSSHLLFLYYFFGYIHIVVLVVSFNAYILGRPGPGVVIGPSSSRLDDDRDVLMSIRAILLLDLFLPSCFLAELIPDRAYTSQRRLPIHGFGHTISDVLF